MRTTILYSMRHTSETKLELVVELVVCIKQVPNDDNHMLFTEFYDHYVTS